MASSTAAKRKLSGSTDGIGISITQTATAGTTIHTAVAGTTAGTYDEVWLWATNNHTANVNLTIEYGNATTTNNIVMALPPSTGLYLVCPGLILQNGNTIKAFAGTTAVVTVHGFVNACIDV